MKTKFNFYNVLNNDYPLFELCEKNGWINEDSDEEFDALSFFEGDPDMIKVNGETGYFYKNGKDIFYWFDCWGTSEEVESILSAFFIAFETGTTIGGESWISGKTPRFVEQISGKDDKYIWDIWDETQTGIAYRGGAGYFYRLFNFDKWLEKYEKRKQAKQAKTNI